MPAIASMWIGDPDSMHVCLLGEEEPAVTPEHSLDRFVEADMLSGHNIRKHNLTIINASMIELGYEPMGPILTSDTLADLRKYRTLPRSQEHLAEMLEVRVRRGFHMTQQDWREANRLTPNWSGQDSQESRTRREGSHPDSQDAHGAWMAEAGQGLATVKVKCGHCKKVLADPSLAAEHVLMHPKKGQKTEKR